MKARIRQNAWDNWYGYLGRKRVMEFVNSSTETQEQQAKRWLAVYEKQWTPWQLSPDSDPSERWILVNASDDREEHPSNRIFETSELAMSALREGRLF